VRRKGFAIKKTRVALEQNRPDVQQAREIFMDGCKHEDPEKFIFLDESGLHLGMSPLYGRAKGGNRVKSYEPFNKGTRVTMIAAIGLEEVKAATFGSWHVDGTIFLEFIRQVLVPVLSKGQIVFMDNLSTHKVAGIRELIEATGAKLVYLPPYSPDLNPIELLWSKLKQFIRKKSARTVNTLSEAISEAFKTITTTDLSAWFEHCGYSVD
jgi:transposase